jgi:hypothetical protein
MFKSIIIFLIFIVSLYAKIEPYNIFPKKSSQKFKIKILDVKRLRFSDVNELSALAYKNNTLFALSDQGILYQFEIKILNNKINKLFLKEKYLLKNKKNRVFKKKKRDSEGLCFYKKGFLISFERKNRILYCSKYGKKILKLKINSLLENNKNYRSENKGLESVVYSKRYGLITTPEYPLKIADKRYHTLYAKDRVWKFFAEGAVTDMSFINETNLLVLLREYSYFTQHRVTLLVEVNLDLCDKNNLCKSEVLAKLDSDKGWKIDNFEGLTKVGKNKFLMISDNNDFIFQKTLLVLFEIMN